MLAKLEGVCPAAVFRHTTDALKPRKVVYLKVELETQPEESVSALPEIHWTKPTNAHPAQ